MQYRSLIKAPDLKISALGMGMMRLPTLGGDESKIDEEAALPLVRAALDAGVNYFDTAWPYHGGASEAFTGKALRELKAGPGVYVATKAPVWEIKKADDWERYLDMQLSRLGRDRVDFYLVHALNAGRWDTTKLTDGLKFLAEAKADGRIGLVGFSFHDALPVFKAIIDGWDGWDFCQVQFNYLDEEFQAGAAGIEYAASRGVSSVVMEPLRGGALAKVPDEVLKIFAGYGRPRMAAEWALRHVLDREEVVTVLSGMNAPGQLWENAAVADAARLNALTRRERETLEAARDWFRSRMPVPCTGCGYCKPCPAGVAIPETFELWNAAVAFGGKDDKARWYRDAYAAKGQGAEACVNCGACLPKCPQVIAVPERLAEAHRELSS